MNKPWYKKPSTLILGAIIVSSWGMGLYSAATDTSTAQISNTAAAAITVQPPAQTAQPVQPQDSQTSQPTELSNNNFYTNVDGNTVHSPAYTNDNSVPDGATAQCRDGTYSFSQHRRGTCSHHGGVARWL